MPQSLARIHLHAAFSTKGREPRLAEARRPELFRVIGGVVNNTGCHSEIVGGVADHVHLLLLLARTATVADVLGAVKGQSSAWVNRTHPELGPFHWQGGYAVFGVSESNADAVREYIARQEEHHRTRTFQEELRELLRKHRVDWDERHVWD